MPGEMPSPALLYYWQIRVCLHDRNIGCDHQSPLPPVCHIPRVDLHGDHVVRWGSALASSGGRSPLPSPPLPTQTVPVW